MGWWIGDVLHCASCEELGPCTSHCADIHSPGMRLDWLLLAVLNFLSYFSECSKPGGTTQNITFKGHKDKRE